MPKAFFRLPWYAGANGYLLKDSSFIEIVAAIRAVCEGGYYVTKSMMGHLLNRQQPPQPAATTASQTANALNPVERRILSLIAQKKSSREIADDFGASIRTIENRRAAICEKLGLSGVNSLLKYALDHKSDLH